MLRWLAVPVVAVGALAASPGTAGAETSAPNPNFNGYCDATTETCPVMQPQGNSNTVWGEVAYAISGTTITFTITPDPSTATPLDVQYCDSATPYETITANLCAGFDRQLGDDGPASTAVSLEEGPDGTFTGSTTFNPDEPYWTVHMTIQGETVYVVGNELTEGEGSEGPTCPQGTTGADTNGNGTMDEGECQTPTCPQGTTGADTNGNGTMDQGECQTPTCPTAPRTPS